MTKLKKKNIAKTQDVLKLYIADIFKMRMKGKSMLDMVNFKITEYDVKYTDKLIVLTES